MEEEIFKKGQAAVLRTALATVIFASLKAVAGFLTGSMVLTADAIHGASDSVTTFLAWAGIRIARKKPTRKFPYGFYKVENVTALLISGFILFAGFEIVREAWGRIGMLTPDLPLVVMILPVLDAVFMFFIGRYELEIGQEINSQSLIADGKEAKMHVLISSVVLVGLISSFFKVPYVEPAAAILISLIIFKEGLESLKDSVFSLLDVSPSTETEEEVRKALEGVAGLRSYKNLKLRSSGPFILGEVVVEVPRSADAAKIRDISRKIESRIKEKVGRVDSFTVMAEPARSEKQTLCVPVRSDEGLNSKISEHFGRASYFLFVELEGLEVKDTYFEENPYKRKEKRAGLTAVDFVLSKNVNSVITKELGPIALHSLRDQLVDVYGTQENRAKDAIELFKNKELKVLPGATKEKT